MSQGLDLPQGGFRAPRVPLDLRCVMLGAVAYLAIRGIDLALEWAWNTPSPIAQLVDLIARQLDAIAFVGWAFRRGMSAVWGWTEYTLTWWQTLLAAFSFLVIWSFFGAAILRTAALKLTRDEPLSLRESLRFGARNFVPFLLAPVLVLLFAGFFFLCNALAGLVMSIPLVGSSILALVLFPLVLVSSLLIILALLGGFVGLPLMWAGIAVEQNGPLEALSRAFSYIFARPFRFFFGYFLIFVVMSIVVLAASHFDRTVKETTKFGVVYGELDELIAKHPGEPDVLRDEYLDSERAKREAEGIANLSNLRRASWTEWVGFVWMWLLLSLFLLGFKGYALYLFLGGTTSLYLQLRREVDGTDEEEIYPESEAEMLAAGEEPRWVGKEESEAAQEPEGNPPEGDGGQATE